MNFEEVCPQFVQIDANKMNTVDFNLSCPICGSKIVANGEVVENFCVHVLWYSVSELDLTKLGPVFEIDTELPSITNKDDLLSCIGDIDTTKEVLQVLSCLSNNCVVYCYNHLEQGCSTMNVVDCLIVRFPDDPDSEDGVMTIADWLASR